MKEEYNNKTFVLEKIKFGKYQWVTSVYFKMVNLLLGQQGSYTKYLCFLCLWDSRAKRKHCIRKKRAYEGKHGCWTTKNNFASTAYQARANEAFHVSS